MKYKKRGPYEGDYKRRLPRIVGSLDNEEVFVFEVKEGGNIWKDLSLDEDDELASIIN